jgi:hypothetical protein
MAGAEHINFTFPEIREFWDLFVRRQLISAALWLMLILVTIANKRREVGDDWLVAAYLVFAGVSLAASLTYWSHRNKLTPRLNQRFAIEFMLRTGNPLFTEDIDILLLHATRTAISDSGPSNANVTCSPLRQRDLLLVCSQPRTKMRARPPS